ncbi:hypothetical protein RRSWK_04771 [Rhodopirellula sp. SWK7]|nr:hypothetical protein RRSWK_04771 [Rhodopirellula sp. SWK7]
MRGVIVSWSVQEVQKREGSIGLGQRANFSIHLHARSLQMRERPRQIRMRDSV